MSDKKLWSGRFNEPTDAFVEAFTASVEFDQRLYKYDIQGSIAHATMLAQQEIVFARHRRLKGHAMEVVIDGPAERAGLWVARSQRQAPDVDGVTLVRSEKVRPGRFVQVTVTGARDYDLTAVPCGECRRGRLND